MAGVGTAGRSTSSRWLRGLSSGDCPGGKGGQESSDIGFVVVAAGDEAASRGEHADALGRGGGERAVGGG